MKLAKVFILISILAMEVHPASYESTLIADGLNSTATLLAGPIRTRSLQLGDKAEKAFIKNL
jgi:hypothetical protein